MEELRKLKHVPIRGLRDPYIVTYFGEFDKIAHFHLISEKDKFEATIALFSNHYVTYTDDTRSKYLDLLNEKQRKDLDKFLRKPYKKARKVESNWSYIAVWINDNNNLGYNGYKEEQPDYTKLYCDFVEHHLSDPVKVDEFDEFDVIVYKEYMNQPHFHLISRKRDIDLPIQIFTFGQYLFHEGMYEDEKKLHLNKCVEFDRWINRENRWEKIRDAYFDINPDKLEIIGDSIEEENIKPSYINLFEYYNCGWYEHFEIYSIK